MRNLHLLSISVASREDLTCRYDLGVALHAANVVLHKASVLLLEFTSERSHVAALLSALID